jgi:hypothetical protein
MHKKSSAKPAHKAKKHVSKTKHEKVIKKAMKHPDKLGAGAKKRKKLSPKNKEEVVMKEFKRHTLNSGSGHKVTDRKQAIAIAMSEAGKSKKKAVKKKPVHKKKSK